MATFKAEVQNKRADGTYNVRIRVTHNRVVRRLSTNLYVTDADLTRSLNFKNNKVIDQCDELIKKCRQACNDLGYEINTLDVDDLVIVLKKHLEGGEKFKLDFVNYMTTQAAKMKKSTGVTYLNTANALLRFLGDSPLDIADVNVAFLRSFETFLENEPSQRGANRKTEKKDLPKKGPRAISMYMGCVRAIHNLAKNEFNDEDNDYIPIPYSPFKKYKIKPQPKTRKRALTVKQIQKIIDLPYNENSRRTLAKDCFILSFALVGMNSIDLYNAPRAVLGTLNYNRAKTADRRDDDAEMKVKIEDCILQIVDKYKGLRHQFNFNKRYASPANFNRALNIGLKEIGAEIGEDKLEFYAARHSWATIARSAEINIDKATVHEALNHVDKSMKVTDIYIDRDWSVIWNANKKVLSLFDWSNVGYDVL